MKGFLMKGKGELYSSNSLKWTARGDGRNSIKWTVLNFAYCKDVKRSLLLQILCCLSRFFQSDQAKIYHDKHSTK